MGEKWKTISEYPNYSVSSYGRVRSEPRLSRNRYGLMVIPGKILKPLKWGDAYAVRLYDGQGNWKQKSIPHLVLTTFVGLRPKGMEACHFPDRDVANNRLENLRWDTHLENINDCRSHGTLVRAVGEKHGFAVLKETEVSMMRLLFQTGLFRGPELSDMYGTTSQNIRSIVHYKTWKHIQ